MHKYYIFIPLRLYIPGRFLKFLQTTVYQQYNDTWKQIINLYGRGTNRW